jgi:hypothetical protein
VLVILFSPFGFLAPKDLIIWLSTIMALSVLRGYCSFGGIVDYHYLNKNVDITSSAHNAFLE